MKNNHSNPWLGLWVHPRKAFQHILDTHPLRAIIWLAVIGGVASALSWLASLWIEQPARMDLQSPLFVTVLLVGGAIFGLIHLYLGGWLYQITGNWIGGKGVYTNVKCAVGWVNYPFILANLFSIATLFFIHWPWIQLILLAINFVIFIWGIVMFIKMVAQAHQFSSWRAIACILLTALLVFVALMIVSLVVPLVIPLFTS